MLSYFKLATATLLTLITISFAQDVTLTLDDYNLNYTTNQPIAGFQFSHDGFKLIQNLIIEYQND